MVFTLPLPGKYPLPSTLTGALVKNVLVGSYWSCTNKEKRPPAHFSIPYSFREKLQEVTLIPRACPGLSSLSVEFHGALCWTSPHIRVRQLLFVSPLVPQKRILNSQSPILNPHLMLSCLLCALPLPFFIFSLIYHLSLPNHHSSINNQ